MNTIDVYGTHEKQRELLQNLKNVDAFFTEHGIVYSLSSGSLLGAIRHEGFIPWDDDVDIMVDRGNFEKIIDKRSLLKEYDIEPTLWIYRIKRKTAEKGDCNQSGIDIFIMDRCPNNTFLAQLKVFLVRALQGMMHEKLELQGFSALQRVALTITYIIGRPFSYQAKLRMYRAISMIGSNRKTKMVSGYNDLYKLVSIRYSSSLMEQMTKTKFEDTEFPVTKLWDEYLRAMYGDYMTPPKDKERQPTHSTIM